MDSTTTFLKSIPSPVQALQFLLKADARIQLRQRRALFMSLLMPIIFLISWRSLIDEFGAANILAICVAIGLPAIGLMSYSQTVARDRERGVFQRLRIAPIPTWTIMVSRILVQMGVIAFMTVCTCLFAYFVDQIHFSLLNLLLLVLGSILGGLSFLAIGQCVVAFVKSSEAVNAAARLIYFPLAIVGALGQIGLFGSTTQQIVAWSPFGTTQAMLAAAMAPATIDMHILWAVLVTLGYSLVFAAIGIRKFQWN